MGVENLTDVTRALSWPRSVRIELVGQFAQADRLDPGGKRVSIAPRMDDEAPVRFEVGASGMKAAR